MAAVLIILGATLILATIADLLSATLSVASVKGLVSSRIADVVWRQVLRLRLSHQRLQRVGLVLVATFVAGWALLLWVGWSLIFIGAGDAVVNSTTRIPASVSDRVFYAGYLVSTLGNGDFTVDGTVWQVVTVLASISGLVAVTLAITFMVPLVSGVVHRRMLAGTIASLGDTPEGLLEHAWDGNDFSSLTSHLSGLVPELHMLTQRHIAYPMMHYFHSDQRHQAIAPMVSVLDETLLILEHGVTDTGVDRLTLGATRSSIAELVRLLEMGFVDAAGEAPPAPDLQWARHLGAVTVDDAEFDRVLDEHSWRRRVLLGFVESDGWGWEDVYEIGERPVGGRAAADGDGRTSSGRS